MYTINIKIPRKIQYNILTNIPIPNNENNMYTLEPQLFVFAINRTHSSKNLKISMDCRYICSYNRAFYII